MYLPNNLVNYMCINKKTKYINTLTGYVSEKQKNSVIPDANLECGYKEISLNRRNTALLNFDQFAAKDIVFRRCGQKEPLPFNQCYPDSLLKNCQKIGEGVFGEVFLFRNQENTTTVMKIIPIEGDQIVNGEKQKKYEEILSEIEIAMELSNLRNNNVNRTSAFIEILNVKCVQGRYPDKLLDLWELYDEVKHSQNDSPEMFNNQQLYIILELSNGGRDLESYVFNNASQAYSVFRQTALALACAENQLKFEHRDLHWGNLLITPTDQKKINYSINGKDIEVTTLGVIISIIDFTLSRIQCDDVVIFNDLSQDDELFLSKGDYQFDIYRLMQQHNGNEWQHFEPYTNILWLHYILEKTLSSLRYKNIKTKIHKEYLTKIKKLHEEILTYNSTLDFINSKFL